MCPTIKKDMQIYKKQTNKQKQLVNEQQFRTIASYFNQVTIKLLIQTLLPPSPRSDRP